MPTRAPSVPLARPLTAAFCALAAVSGCRAPAAAASSSSRVASRAPAAPGRPLASLAAQRIIVTPALAVREGDPLGWAARIPRLREYLRVLDDEISAALADRGLGQAWVFPDQLWRGHARNPSLGVDPYRLATQSLRGSRLAVGDRLAEPLASQLRALVAVHDARLVLLPVEVFFEPDRAGGGGRTGLRLALVDARFAELRWSGEVRAEHAAAEPDRAQLAELAARLADLVAAP
jgi:hypothetical protein